MLCINPGPVTPDGRIAAFLKSNATLPYKIYVRPSAPVYLLFFDSDFVTRHHRYNIPTFYGYLQYQTPSFSLSTSSHLLSVHGKNVSPLHIYPVWAFHLH